MIELEDVAKVYQMGTLEVAALQGVSLSIDSGELLAIMGPFRLREVDDDEHNGMPGRAKLRTVLFGWCGGGPPRRQSPGGNT